MNFLHTFSPQPILFHLGFVTVYWYGLLMALAILAGLSVSVRVAKWHGVKAEVIYDLFFYVVSAGFIGARIFYVLYNPIYFWQRPLDIFKIWQGGIAIHGALIFGVLAIIWFARHLTPDPASPAGGPSPSKGEGSYVLSQSPLLSKGRELKAGEVFWKLAAIIAPGLALGQAIGRWGNYFNQELFGQPTNLPWGIPIDLADRPVGFEQFNYFHPTFLYESIGSLAIFGVLLYWHWHKTHNAKRITQNAENDGRNCYMLYVICYVFLYSTLRFLIEFLRIDPTAGSVLGVRATMGLSFLLMTSALAGVIFLLSKYFKRKASS